MSGASSHVLRDRFIMVVEDEYMIADEVARMLAETGATVLGPVGSLSEAMQLAATENQIDGALLDVNLRGQKIWPLVDTLRARGVPLVLATGYDSDAIPSIYLDLPRCEKPVSERDLVSALANALPA